MLERGSHFFGHISVQPFVSICKCGDTIYLFLNWKNPHLIDRIPEWEWTWELSFRCVEMFFNIAASEREISTQEVSPLFVGSQQKSTYKFGFYLSKSRRQVLSKWHPPIIISSGLSTRHMCWDFQVPFCSRLWASILAGPSRLSSITGLLDPAVLLLSSKILLAALVALSHSWLTEAFYTWSCVSQHPPPLVPLILGVPSRPYMYPHSVGPNQDLFESPSSWSFNEMQNHC